MPVAKVELKMTGEWKRMAAAMDSKRFEKNLEANINKATIFNGLMVAGEIRRRIKARKYAKNSELTVLIKRSSTPLIDDADLWGSVTSKNISAYAVFVGVLRTTLAPNGRPMVNLAEFLHSGGAFPVTEHMRNLFILLSEVGQGKRDKSTLTGRAAELAKALGKRIEQIKPLKPSTTHIVVPPRPFLTDVLNDARILKKCEANWRKAAQAAMKDQASGSPGKGGSPGASAEASNPDKKSASSPGGGKPSKSPANRSEAAKRGWQTRRSKAAPPTK
jgi:hypothetical protein